ncbi:FecCD family ABC transporter permease [Pedobacter cryoconitis]|uniref:Iron complex transport system permease protein n=1 Tax=Pedobacter cryoconitis TaxID=188932 RepID=A0A7X0J886_9SPHI|nr:iron ABC transporter permease [Pedobacter cryoconitis]MBB6502464.1 iron complex transport system permease protein [Pedobacter cryoconitis]
MSKKTKLILILLSLLLLAVVILSSCLGAVRISMAELLSIIAYKTGLSETIGFKSQQAAVLMNIRLPRVVLGVLIGAGLGVSGAAIQGLFRNPLAEPGLIGISAGGTLFAVLMIVMEFTFFTKLNGVIGFYAISISAFIGAALATLIVYRMSTRNGKTAITMLLLSGIAITALASAFVGLLTYMATNEQLPAIAFWSLGSLGGANWETVTGVMPFILIPVAILPFLAKSLNALALGEAQALHMGINVVTIKRIIIVLATMAVGTSVAVSGIIGFIGLIIPHILRMTFTADNRLVIPGAAILGAALLTIADLIARTIVAPGELPIGILTALIGTPVFISIIISERNKNKL